MESIKNFNSLNIEDSTSEAESESLPSIVTQEEVAPTPTPTPTPAPAPVTRVLNCNLQNIKAYTLNSNGQDQTLVTTIDSNEGAHSIYVDFVDSQQNYLGDNVPVESRLDVDLGSEVFNSSNASSGGVTNRYIYQPSTAGGVANFTYGTPNSNNELVRCSFQLTVLKTIAPPPKPSDANNPDLLFHGGFENIEGVTGSQTFKSYWGLKWSSFPAGFS